MKIALQKLELKVDKQITVQEKFEEICSKCCFC